MVLTLPRLVVRDFERSDWKAVQQYAGDPEVVRYMEWGPNTERETRTFVQRAIGAQLDRSRRDFELAIVQGTDGAVIGACGIHVSSPEHREGWIGYCLRRDAWGKGYATEAAAGLLDFGFRDLALHRIFATCDPRNIASARVLEKAGMRCEAHLRQHRWQKAEWRDSLVYAILEHERLAAP